MPKPTVVSIAALILATTLGMPTSGQTERVLRELNNSLNVNISGKLENKSYPIILDAFVQMEDAPRRIGRDFNQYVIHPSMPDWALISGWTESNQGMAAAIIEAAQKTLFGMPYGEANVPNEYVDAGLVTAIGVRGSLRNIEFRYFNAIDIIAAYATAETYRRLEAGQVEPAIDLAMAHVMMLRQLCDRDFLDEKMKFIAMLSDALEIFRDQLYEYHDRMPGSRMRQVAFGDIPFLRPDRTRLLMPEADRVVSVALIEEVFDSSTGAADAQKFAKTFASIQAKDAPLTQLGAARRWEMIAPVHASLEDSLTRLGLIYDDWWRRWRVEEYDPVLDVPTQFERTNPIHYAAVIYSTRDVQAAFEIRNQLIAEVNATAMAIGLCGYDNDFGTYPSNVERVYAQFAPRRSDVDPFEPNFGLFGYRYLSARTAVDTLQGRLWIEPGEGLLYSRGRDHEDQRGAQHTDDGSSGDIIMWPPMRLLKRNAGFIR